MRTPYLDRAQNGNVRLLVDGKSFTMLAGEVHNSTSSSACMFGEALDRAVELGMNTVLAPVTWELIEPVEGAFDFSMVDMMLAAARERGLRLGLLWFGAWKNAQCYYAPAWVKRDVERFLRAEMIAGQRKVVMPDFHNFPYAALSLFCDETLAADARAYAAFMEYLASADGDVHTVVAVQVENECGEMAAAREHSPEADAAFGEQVPSDLVAALAASSDTLAPDIAAAFAEGAGAGTWSEVFGPVAEELFTTYHMARYVEAVAAAGKRAYPLSTMANCWLDKGHKPGRFPTGGPNVRVMEVWKHVAPSIDMLCPDVYVPTFCQVCDDYRKLGNPLAIPETATHAYTAAREMWAVGHHRALCFAPFGYEDMGEPFDASAGILFGADASDPALRTPQDPAEYACVTRGLSQLLEAVGNDTPMDAVTSERPDENLIALGEFGVRAVFADGALPGACAAARAQDGSLYLLAMRCMVAFESLDVERPHVDILALEDGEVCDGVWHRDRKLNGDEAAVLRCDAPVLLRVELFAYA